MEWVRNHTGLVSITSLILLVVLLSRDQSVWVFLAACYFLPTIVAAYRHHQAASVAVVNLFFGWTFVGWVVALVMAVRDKPRPAPV